MVLFWAYIIEVEFVSFAYTICKSTVDNWSSCISATIRFFSAWIRLANEEIFSRFAFLRGEDDAILVCTKAGGSLSELLLDDEFVQTCIFVQTVGHTHFQHDASVSQGFPSCTLEDT